VLALLLHFAARCIPLLACLVTALCISRTAHPIPSTATDQPSDNRAGQKTSAGRAFLGARGGGIASAGSEATAAGLRAQATGMGRALQLGDSRVAAGAMREGNPLITQDRKFGNFLRAIGYRVEGF
jgi:hypothetical protein